LKPTSLSAGWFFVATIKPLDITSPFWKTAQKVWPACYHCGTKAGIGRFLTLDFAV
jgi:hypothetical protein